MANPASVADAALAALEGVDEQNEVLQFLLGNTPSIPSTTVSVSKCASSTEHAETNRMKNFTKCGAEVSLIVPPLEPASETDNSDDDASGGVTPRSAPCSPREVCEPRSQQHCDYQHVGHCDHLSHAKETQNQRMESDPLDLQPEDEDTSFANPTSSQLRQRGTRPPKRDPPGTTAHDARPPRSTRWPSSFASFRQLIATQKDALFIASTLIVLVGYCIAITYRAFHPISYPLPNVDALFKPFDISNVSARFRTPMVGDVFTDAVTIEWEITRFPADALIQHGPEPFEYRVFLNDQQLLFDMDVWSITSDDEVEINRTIHHRLRPRDIPAVGMHDLRLEVTFAIPGSDDELFTLSDTTSFRFSAPTYSVPHLEITSPLNGSVIHTRSFVLEYQAHNIQRLDAILDRQWRVHKTHIWDGNLLLRGLNCGPHLIVLEAFDGDGAMVATEQVYVDVQH